MRMEVGNAIADRPMPFIDVAERDAAAGFRCGCEVDRSLPPQPIELCIEVPRKPRIQPERDGHVSVFSEVVELLGLGVRQLSRTETFVDSFMSVALVEPQITDQLLVRVQCLHGRTALRPEPDSSRTFSRAHAERRGARACAR